MEVNVQIFVANGAKPDDLFPLDVPNQKLVFFRISLNDHLLIPLPTFSNEMNRDVIYLEVMVRNVSEFNSFV